MDALAQMFIFYIIKTQEERALDYQTWNGLIWKSRVGYLSMCEKETFLLEFLPLLSNPYTVSLCITAENPFLTCPLNLYTETGFWKGAVHKLRRLRWGEIGMGKPQRRFTKKTPFKGQLISKFWSKR